MSKQMMVGALLGWKRAASEHGVVFTMQILTPDAAARGREYELVAIAMNERQLRSFARDMTRAATERGITLRASPKWWQRILR